MSLRDTNPDRLKDIIENQLETWKRTTNEERVNQTWQSFFQVYEFVAHAAWEIEVVRGNLAGTNTRNTHPNDNEAQIRDAFAGQALRTSAEIPALLDELEAKQQIIAVDNFGDESTEVGKMSGTLVTLVNMIRPIAEVIQDTAADAKSSTMNRIAVRPQAQDEEPPTAP